MNVIYLNIQFFLGGKCPAAQLAVDGSVSRRFGSAAWHILRLLNINHMPIRSKIMATQTNVSSLISSTTTTANSATFLRRVVLADAIFEAVCAIFAIVGANTLATSTGLFSPAGFTLLGIWLVFGAAFIYWLAVAQPLKRSLITYLMIGNDVFAAAGVLLLIAGWDSFNEGARLLIAILATDLAILAGLEWWGLRRIK
jgi:hypothetical protein